MQEQAGTTRRTAGSSETYHRIRSLRTSRLGVVEDFGGQASPKVLEEAPVGSQPPSLHTFPWAKVC